MAGYLGEFIHRWIPHSISKFRASTFSVTVHVSYLLCTAVRSVSLFETSPLESLNISGLFQTGIFYFALSGISHLSPSSMFPGLRTPKPSGCVMDTFVGTDAPRYYRRQATFLLQCHNSGVRMWARKD